MPFVRRWSSWGSLQSRYDTSKLRVKFWGEINVNTPLIKINKEGHAVAQLVERLFYKPEGRGFDSHWSDWKFPLTHPRPPPPAAALWPWGRLSLQQKWVPGIFPGRVRWPVLRAENLIIFVCDCLTIWEPQPPGALGHCTGIAFF
jgi:hypothetical protein